MGQAAEYAALERHMDITALVQRGHELSELLLMNSREINRRLEALAKARRTGGPRTDYEVVKTDKAKRAPAALDYTEIGRE